jgi:hypothetical protein
MFAIVLLFKIFTCRFLSHNGATLVKFAKVFKGNHKEIAIKKMAPTMKHETTIWQPHDKKNKNMITHVILG